MTFIKKYSTIILILLCVFAEIIISNYNSVLMIAGGYNEKELDISSAELIENKAAEYKDDSIIISDGVIEFKDINEPMANLCIVTDSDYGQYKKVILSFTDDNFAFEDGFEYNRGTFYIYEAEGQKSYLTFSSYGEVKALRISVPSDSKGTLAITSVSLNRPRPLHINFLRLLIFLGIVFVIKYGLWKVTVSDYRYGYKILRVTAAAVCILTCICTVMLTKNPNSRLLSDYNPDKMYSNDQYEQLFYAFTQGKTSLDIDVDVSEFNELENIYDRSERNEKDVDGPFWDRAYYDGNFYCYFGVAPVITVYYPVYILTKHVPTPVLASMILAVYAQIFVYLLYITIIRRMCKDVPLLLAVIGLLAVLSGSLILPIAFEFSFYYMAVLSAMGALAAFLYFLFSAYYEKKEERRIIYLLLSGVSAVGIAASRPTMLLYCFIAIVPAVFIFRDKKIQTKRKIYYGTAIITPVMVGAIVLMIYNYMRFDNPFEFGFNYQLTVSMAKANTISLGMIPSAIYHFFFQQPDFSTHFPYYHMRSRSLEMYPRYNYNGRLIGIFYYPLTAAIFLIPFEDRKKDKFKHSILLSLAGIAVILAFVDMCKAGAHYRYTADILMPLLIIGIIVVFDILSRLKSISPSVYKYAYVLVVVIMVITFITGFIMMFCNETANLMKDYAYMSRIFYRG